MDNELSSLKANDTKPEQYKPWAGHNVDDTMSTKWGGEVNPSDLAIQSNVENLKKIPGMGTQAIKAGTDAANALFAQNTSGISSALSARAKKSFDRGQESYKLNSTLNNIQRQRSAMAQNSMEQATLFKMRKANFAGQLKWADEVSNYNRAMETTKLGLLNSIVNGFGKAAGFAMGGPAGAAVGGEAGKVLS